MRRWISRKSAWDAELISSFVVGGWTRLGPRKYELRAKAVYIVSLPKPYLYPTLPHANKLLLWGSLHGQEAKLLPGHLKIYKYSTLRDLLESLCQVLIFWYLSIFFSFPFISVYIYMPVCEYSHAYTFNKEVVQCHVDLFFFPLTVTILQGKYHIM